MPLSEFISTSVANKAQVSLQETVSFSTLSFFQLAENH